MLKRSALRFHWICISSFNVWNRYKFEYTTEPIHAPNVTTPKVTHSFFTPCGRAECKGTPLSERIGFALGGSFKMEAVAMDWMPSLNGLYRLAKWVDLTLTLIRRNRFMRILLPRSIEWDLMKCLTLLGTERNICLDDMLVALALCIRV